MRNRDETLVLNVANTVPGVSARFATPGEDHGTQKADVVLVYQGREYFLQVSHTPKSRSANERLRTHGTIPIATHAYADMPYNLPRLRETLCAIIGYE